MYLNAMFFLDATHGWYSAGSSGYGGLSASSDGGHTWFSFNLGGQGRMSRLIRFTSPHQGYVVLAGGGRTRAFVSTSDGGATWTQRYPPPAPSGVVQFFDQQQGVGTGTILDAGAILHTADGGRTWIQTASVPIDGIIVMAFSDDQHGCLEGVRSDTGAHVTYETSDGGHTWEPPSTAQTCTMENPPMADTWRVDDERLLVSTDGGATWTQLAVGAGGQRPRLLSAVDERHAWYMDVADHLYVTSDGGRSWTQVQ